jgi:hypothetical protein
MNDINEREWEAQERARRDEGLGLDPVQGDGSVRLYRLVARALRQPPEDALPEDFARQVAARVGGSPVESPPVTRRVESVLLAVLVSILVICAGVILAGGESSWVPAIRAALLVRDSTDIRWLLAFVGCVGLSWVLWEGERRVISRARRV